MAENRPEVPGYAMAHLLGFGATGEVWLARESATGAPVALKLLRAPGDQAGDARMRREATVLASVEHPHVVRLRRVLLLPDQLVLVLDHAAGGSLAALLAARECLTPGEVVTLGAPLADALAHVHRRGVLHGDITPSNVLLTADGRPLLADLGVSRIVGEGLAEADGTTGYVDPAVLAGQPPSAASDVYGLAAVCWTALTGAAPHEGRPLAEDVPPALGRCLEAALDPDTEARPTADELAVALYDSCAAAPLRLADADPLAVGEPGIDHATRRVRPVAGPGCPAPRPSSHRRARRRVPWRVVGGVGAVSVGVTGAVVAGMSWAQAGGGETGVALPSAQVASAPALPGAAAATTSPPSQEPGPREPAPTAPTAREPSSTALPSQEPAPREQSWRDVLDALDATREKAFAEADVSALGDVYAPNSRALRADEETVRALAQRGLRAQGHDFRLVAVEPTLVTTDRAVLSVTDTIGPHRIVDDQGAVVERREGRGERSFEVVLLHRAGRWLIADIA